jgi:hypothetical protein
MSLDQYHWFTAVGQFSKLLSRLPGKKDSYFDARRKDGDLYLSLPGDHSPMLKASVLRIRGYQALVNTEAAHLPQLPPELIGNTLCYQCLDEVVSSLADRRSPAKLSSLAECYTEVVTSTQNLIDGRMAPVTTNMRDIRASDGLALCFKALSEELIECYDVATAAHRKRKEAWDKKDPCGAGRVTFSFVPGGLFRICSLGSLIIVQVSKMSVLLTPEHFRKLSRSLIVFRNLSLLLSDLSLRVDGSAIDIMRLICRLGVKDQSNVGAGFRVLRAYVMAMASDTDTSLSSARRDVMSSFEGVKLEFGLEIINTVLGLTDSYTELTQLGGLYKYVLSPDISMQDCFEAAYGMKEPNHPLGASQRKFRGLLRKRVFLNLLRGKHIVHATSNDTGLNSELNRPSPNISRLEKIPLEKWAEVTFSTLRAAVNYKDVDLRINDKSSSNDLSTPPVSEYSGYNSKWLKGEAAASIATTTPSKKNDVLHTLSTGERPTPRDGYRKFKMLVKSHDLLEKGILASSQYASRYDIPSSLLSSAILSDPSLYYTVNTEPKEGEFHKPAGRLFYMATREMKVYISSVERLCRTIFHGQVGNSIVSSYSRREEQLRSMARSTSSKSQTFVPYFVSFDMSEFSKKFPMELVNEIGEVFAELTGDTELSRLDVIFRAGIVCHSTRGYEGVFAGVRGGFEGFLNFVWTAAHVTIMELALLNTQKQGLVMAYSDDGLLEFIVDPSMSRGSRRQIVTNIQRTYADLGLSFHLFKTLVSTNVFEYLGLVAVDGRYVDTWGKSLSSLGTREQRSAFTPFSDIIDTYVGQARATVEALCPVDLIYYHMLVDIVLVVQRWASSMAVKQILAIMYLPRSMGGLGVPGQLDMCITSERHSLEGFIHTSLMLSASGNSYIDQAIDHILSQEKPKSEQGAALLRGDYYSSYVPRLRGQAVCKRLAEIIAVKAGLAEVADPLTPSLVRSLLRLTRTFSDFPLPLFLRLISSSPPMQAYSKRLEVASSRGAFNFLGRQEVRHAQSSDSSSVRAMLQHWKAVFSSAYERKDRGTSPSLVLFNRVNSNLTNHGFAPLRLRAESILTLSLQPEDAAIYGRVNCTYTDFLGSPVHSKKLDDSVYVSPNMTSGSPDTTPVFDSSEGISKGLPDRMLKVIGRLLTICPEAIDSIFTMVGLLGGSVPTLPLGVTGDLSRLRALMRGKPSVIVKVPQTLYALSTVEYMRKFTSAAIQGKVTDYTTPLMTCRALTAIYSYRMGDLSKPPVGKERKIWLSLKSEHTIEDLAYEPPVTLISTLPLDLRMKPVQEDGPLTVRLVMTLLEEMKLRVNIISTEKESPDSRRHLAHALSQRLARRIHMKISGLPRGVIIDERMTTDDETINSEIARLTFLEVARIELRDVKGRDGSLDDRKNAFLATVDALSEELPLFMGEPDFHRALFDGAYSAYEAQTEMSTLITRGRSKTVITEPVLSPQSYRELISKSIKEMYAGLFRGHGGLKWGGLLEMGSHGSPSLVPSERGSYHVDYILDALTSMLSSIRPSTHREKPYNQTTFAIHYCKLMIISARMFRTMQDLPKEESQMLVAAESLTEAEVRELKKAFVSELGPDHTALLYSPLGDICAKRASIYARWRSHHYPNTLPVENGSEAAWQILESARAVQHFLNGVISHYLTHSVAHIPTQVLRSTEAEHILSGLWQMRNLYMTPLSLVPASEGLPDHNLTGCLASQMKLLMRRVTARDTPMSVQIEVGATTRALLSSVKKFSKYGIDVFDPLDTTEEPADMNFQNYPGSDEHIVGNFYYFSYTKIPAKDMVSILAYMSSAGEVVADLMTHGGSCILVGTLFMTTPQSLAGEVILGETKPGVPLGPEGAEAGGEHEGRDAEYDLSEEDIRMLVGTPSAVAVSRRTCEAGFSLPTPDPLDINPPVLLARSTGVGLARQGGWEGTIVPNERHLVGASIRSHAAASPKDLVVGSALAWSSLKLPPDVSSQELTTYARAVIARWKRKIRSAQEEDVEFMRMGVHSEISEIATWLRAQNFQLPVIEEASVSLAEELDLDISGLEDAAGKTVWTEFTTLSVGIDHLRKVATNVTTFSSLAKRILLIRRGGDPLLLSDDEVGSSRGTSSEIEGGDQGSEDSPMGDDFYDRSYSNSDGESDRGDDQGEMDEWSRRFLEYF